MKAQAFMNVEISQCTEFNHKMNYILNRFLFSVASCHSYNWNVCYKFREHSTVMSSFMYQEIS